MSVSTVAIWIFSIFGKLATMLFHFPFGWQSGAQTVQSGFEVQSLPPRGVLVQLDFGEVGAERPSQRFLNASSNGLLKAPFFPGKDFFWERGLTGGG